MTYLYRNGDIPLLNDSAYNIAPTSRQLFDYAQRLGVESAPITLKECGYRKLENCMMEAIVDVGNVTATYQPGHTHADTFNYELRINGIPFVVDTGISTYNKNERRQYERSTAAHNTVTVDNKDSSEVWGGFRVGNRAEVALLNESGESLTAQHRGFKGCIHRRRFLMKECAFLIRDELTANRPGVGYIHLAPSVQVLSCSGNMIETSEARIQINGGDSIKVRKNAVSVEYNRLQPSYSIEIKFHGTMEYQINK